MKKLLFLFLAITFSLGVQAQDEKIKQDNMQSKDHVMMKDGKMWMMKDGKTVMMDKDMTLSNGTMVSTTGNLKMSDGKTMTMKNGDMIDMDGMMGRPDMTKDKSKMK